MVTSKTQNRAMQKNVCMIPAGWRYGAITPRNEERGARVALSMYKILFNVLEWLPVGIGEEEWEGKEIST